MVVLGASFALTSSSGERVVAANDFFLGSFDTLP